MKYDVISRRMLELGIFSMLLLLWCMMISDHDSVIVIDSAKSYLTEENITYQIYEEVKKKVGYEVGRVLVSETGRDQTWIIN